MGLNRDTARKLYAALGERGRYWIVLAGALLFFALAVSWRDARTGRPMLVQGIVDEVGMRQVEGHARAIRAAALESGVDPALIAAICFLESRGRTGQVSSAGAMGLMQLMPSAAADAARRLGIKEPTEQELIHDAELNLRLGAAHLAWLLEHRGDWSLEEVLVAYNAGRSRLKQWIEASGSYQNWVREQERRLRSGEPRSGSLDYAREVLAKTRAFRRRGRI